MDLHLTADQPSLAEKSAVDGELGGESRPDRHRLLPALHAIQSRVGHITPGALNYLARRLDVAPAEIHGVASFYGMFSTDPAGSSCGPRLRRHRLSGTRRGDTMCRTREDRRCRRMLPGNAALAWVCVNGRRRLW